MNKKRPRRWNGEAFFFPSNHRVTARQKVQQMQDFHSPNGHNGQGGIVGKGGDDDIIVGAGNDAPLPSAACDLALLALESIGDPEVKLRVITTNVAKLVDDEKALIRLATAAVNVHDLDREEVLRAIADGLDTVLAPDAVQDIVDRLERVLDRSKARRAGLPDDELDPDLAAPRPRFEPSEEILRLARLNLRDYEQERSNAAKRLGMRPRVLDTCVRDERKKINTGYRRRGQEPDWPDVTDQGMPKKTCANARAAIEALNVVCRYDEFHDGITITAKGGGDAFEHLSGGNIDHAVHLLRFVMYDAYSFDPGKDHAYDAIMQLALNDRFDPVREYLDGLQWDGVRRLDTWLTTYLSAEDTDLNRAFGRLVLVAAVRRVRQPGCKFDHVLVLEGPEGTQKSTTVALLALEPRNFSDQTILGLADNKQQEQLRGKWLYEIAEMHGMKRSEVEQIKAFITRTHDRGRPAYGRSVIDQPRRCVFIGTTNNDKYLKSQTGNRRFWPVKTATIYIDDLRRDRDQLWAEAAAMEATGMSLVLPYELWDAATEAQNERLEEDPWQDILERVTADKYPADDGSEEHRISTRTIFTDWLNIAADKWTNLDNSRVRNVMKRLGWIGPERVYVDGKQVRGYRREVSIQSAES